MRQWIGSALFQIMACRLFGTKPLSKPVPGYCQLDPWEQISVKFESKYNTFDSGICIWKRRLRNGGHFVPGRWFKSLCNLISTAVFVCLWIRWVVIPTGHCIYSYAYNWFFGTGFGCFVELHHHESEPSISHYHFQPIQLYTLCN